MKDKLMKNSELIISLVLQIGVGISAVVILTGLALFFTQNTSLNATSYHSLTNVSYSFPHSLASLRSSLRGGDGIGFIVLGILLLILTPVARVATSILIFIRERDRPMAIVTLLVLILLISSFYVGTLTK